MVKEVVLAVEPDELAELTRNMVAKILHSRPDKDDDPKPEADGEKSEGKPADKKSGDSPNKALDLDKPLDLDKLLDDDKPRKGKSE